MTMDNNENKKPQAGPPLMAFAMPMYHDFVPKWIRPWIYVVLAFCFQFSNGMYLGAMNNVVGEWGIMREDVQMCLYATLIGMALYFPVLFRMKFHFSNKSLLMASALVIIVCNLLANSELWVVANYRETQLPGIAVGSKVKVTADAVPGKEFVGTVERISDATGSAFSIIPQDNATGNFVKVEQRIPVRIHLDGDRRSLAALRAGMNVECTTIKK